MAKEPRGIFVVDEAYAEFAQRKRLDLVREFENVIVVRTVSKSYSLAGARLGYAIGHEKWIAEMFKVKDPFNVTRMTQSLVPRLWRTRNIFEKYCKNHRNEGMVYPGSLYSWIQYFSLPGEFHFSSTAAKG